jgi:hypothetical protein
VFSVIEPSYRSSSCGSVSARGFDERRNVFDDGARLESAAITGSASLSRSISRVAAISRLRNPLSLQIVSSSPIWRDQISKGVVLPVKSEQDRRVAVRTAFAEQCIGGRPSSGNGSCRQ